MIILGKIEKSNISKDNIILLTKLFNDIMDGMKPAIISNKRYKELLEFERKCGLQDIDMVHQ